MKFNLLRNKISRRYFYQQIIQYICTYIHTYMYIIYNIYLTVNMTCTLWVRQRSEDWVGRPQRHSTRLLSGWLEDKWWYRNVTKYSIRHIDYWFKQINIICGSTVCMHDYLKIYLYISISWKLEKKIIMTTHFNVYMWNMVMNLKYAMKDKLKEMKLKVW